MARNDRDRQRDRRRSKKLYRRARRDLQLSTRPARRQARRDYRYASNQAQNIYGGYNEALAGIPPVDTAGMSDALRNQLMSFAGALQGAGLPASEVGSATGVFQGVGEGGLSLLASQGARGAEYAASAIREGALAERAARDNLLQQLMGTLGDLRITPAMIQQRVDELRQQRLENRLVRGEIDSQEAMSQYLMDIIGAQLQSDRRPGRRR
jgi:hypothetical protein